MIPQETITKIIESTDIVAVISEHVKLNKRGINHVGCCPFHSEKTASFVVSPAKGIFKCFGCGVSGNAVKFIEQVEQITWIEAIKQLAEIAKIDLPKRDISPEERAAIHGREKLFIVNDFAQSHFVSNLPQGKGYMIGRGFDDADLEKFGIGYAPDSWDALLLASKKQGHKPETMIEAGFLAKSDAGKVYDRFRGRVIFPIHTASGKLSGFTGRVISTEGQTAKYLNSPDSIIFHKGNNLYGLVQAKSAIIKEGRCNLVEGNTDVMRWHKCGIANTVATCGTALTPAHAKLIHRFTDNLTIIFDGDSAGIKAATKGIEVCVAEGLNVYVAVLPEGEDPDSFARDKTEKELRAWIESNEKDFIVFRAEQARTEIEKKPAERVRIINELTDIITKMPDAVTQSIYFGEVSKVFKTDVKLFAKTSNLDNSDIFGIEANSEEIRKADEVFIYTDKEKCMFDISTGRENVIVIPGYPLKSEHIGAIEVLTKNLMFIDPIINAFDIEKEPDQVKDLKKLSDRGFRISITPPDGDKYDSKFVSFTELYFKLLNKNCDRYNTDSQKTAIESSAAFLAQRDKTTISIKTGEIAKMFGITKAAFEQVLKPYINKQKSKANINFEAITVDDEPFSIDDIDKLPDYVDRNFFSKFRHFPVQNKHGKKIFYMFQGDNGQLFRVGNFYMEPQFHVRNEDPNRNKRIVRLNHAEINLSQFAEIASNEMIEFGPFKKFLFRLGPYIFRNGKPQHLDMILDSTALEFPITDELGTQGQQKEDFWVFCNAIFADGEIKYMNELGLVEHNNKTYYSPSVSCIYKDLREEDDKHADDRYHIYRDTNLISITDWAALMLKVYKYNDNGYWAIIMAIMSAFRSDIFKIDRLFTTLFFIGPTGCGKSEIAQSIRAVFMHHEAPMFNLNSGSDAAFFTLMERVRDIPLIMEEYQDKDISDGKFQGLKAAVYDGEGKTKRRDASSSDLNISKINGVPILLGQESPERDDASLTNRVVVLSVKKNDYWTDEETANFQALKKYEKKGLTNILVEVLKHREIVRQQFQPKLRMVQKEIRDDLRGNNIAFEPRISNTVSLFATMVKLIEEEVTSFKLPFTYKDFYQIARRKLIEQSEGIHKTNRLAVFFDTLMMLTEDNSQRGLVKGKEYKIEQCDTIEVRKGRSESEVVDFKGNPTKLLFLRLDMIHPKYRDRVGVQEHLKMNNLLAYLRDHPAYIGQVKMTAFKWDTETRADNGSGTVVSVMKEECKRTSATVFNYEMMHDELDLGESFSKDDGYYKEKMEEGMKHPALKELELEMNEAEPKDDLPF